METERSEASGCTGMFPNVGGGEPYHQKKEKRNETPS